MELIRVFLWTFYMTMLIGGIFAWLDGRLILEGKTNYLRPKWLFNTVEAVLIVSFSSLKLGFLPLPWWHMLFLYFTLAWAWWIIHDCGIGAVMARDWWYLGQSKWDRKMSATFNQFGVRPGKLFFFFKLFWFGILSAGFFSL